MATIRVIKDGNFTVMSNVHLQDTRLSLKAVGLLSKLLSLKDDWEYSVEGLTRICKEGKDAITAALKELEACGYLTRRQTHDAGGKLSGMEYLIYEKPQGEFTVDGKPANGEPLTDYPSTEKPSTEKPLTENPPQLNTKILNTKIPPIVPQTGDGESEKGKSEVKVLPERFRALWEYYPHDKRGNKAKAVRAWNRLKPTPALVDTISRAMKTQFASEDWKRGVGVPHVSTYLNSRYWEDAADLTPAMPPTADGWAPDPEVY